MQIEVVLLKKKKKPESTRTDKLGPLGNSCLSFFVFSFFSSAQGISVPALSCSLSCLFC